MRNSTLMCQKLLVQLQTIPAISRQSSNATRLARTATKRNMTWVRNQWRSWMLATSSTRNGRRIATSSRHVRCASHTLNLVATADIDPGKIGNQQYSQMYHMTTGKCQSLWNLVNRSPKASDAVPQLCPSTAVLSPCPIQVGTYDTVRRLLEFGYKLAQMFHVLQLPKLSLHNDFNDFDFENHF